MHSVELGDGVCSAVLSGLYGRDLDENRKSRSQKRGCDFCYDNGAGP
jgi:hypothetical protein